MRKIVKAVRLILACLIVLFALAVGAILAYRAHRQRVNARAMAIPASNGIDEGMYIKVGGIDQWIQIRGQDRSNPVLLCLHGGPGASWLPLTMLFVPWEKEFTVVQWDQRGTGKTLEATGRSVADTMSIERMAQDSIEVSEFLRNRLRKNKIILLGHSWGSILGIHLARKRPDLFYAYIGTGQVANMQKSMQIGYAHVLEKARITNDEQAVKELENLGPPPYDSSDRVVVYFRWLGRKQLESDRVAQTSLVGALTFGAPNYSLWDIYNRIRGFTQIPPWRLYRDMLSTDLTSLGLDFQTPIFFFQGAEDEVTVTALARDYFDRIHAPRKEFVLLGGGGHFAVWSMPNKFLQELVARVRPLAVQR